MKLAVLIMALLLMGCHGGNIRNTPCRVYNLTTRTIELVWIDRTYRVGDTISSYLRDERMVVLEKVD